MDRRGHRAGTWLLGVFLTLSFSACGPIDGTILGAPVHTAEIYSRTFHIRDLYMSMKGPTKTRPLDLGARPRELLWITGVRMQTVDMDGAPLTSQENFCHAQIRSGHSGRSWAEHNQALFAGTRHLPAKWFTLIAGRLAVEFPDGFGIPMHSDEPIEAFTMALNMDPDFEPFDFRVRTQIDYVYDSELDRPMRALSKTGIQSTTFVDHTDHDHSHAHEGESCALDGDEVVTTSAPPPSDQTPLFHDGSRELTMHFMVPPGRHVFRNREQLMGLPPGTDEVTAHYIAAHLHVYGESIELIDVTDGRSIFKSISTDNEKHTGVADMTDYSSHEGVKLYRNHEYEVVATYNNTTDHEVDAMGVFYIYFENPDFQRIVKRETPAPPDRATRG